MDAENVKTDIVDLIPNKVILKAQRITKHMMMMMIYIYMVREIEKDNQNNYYKKRKPH